MSSNQWELSGNAENVDWNDIAQAGRAYADNLVGEPGISKFMHIMADEIERLRPRPDEREALTYVCSNVLPDGSREGDDALYSLRNLRERTK